MQAPAALGEGALFAGRYRVVRKIAAGGMGTVYEAVHTETGRARALKVMHAHLFQSEEMHDRFRREARIASQVVSEYIVDVLDAGIDEATQAPFLVMELLQGEDLGQRLKRVGKLAPAEALTHLQQVGLALDKTHASSIVHRDLKPDNVFLTTRDDGSTRVKIFDFGVAKLVAESATSAGATRSLGTPLYMAPEQFRVGSKLLPAADIYALGMMAYTLLVGKPYWATEAGSAGDVIAFAMAVVLGPQESAVRRASESGVTLPPAFDAWFAKATAPAAEDRYATASEAIRALASALAPAPAQAAVPASAPVLTPPVVAPPTPQAVQQAPSAVQPVARPMTPQAAAQQAPSAAPPVARPHLQMTAPLAAAQQAPSAAQPVFRPPAATPFSAAQSAAPAAQPVFRPTVPLLTPQPMTASTPRVGPEQPRIAVAPAPLEMPRQSTPPLPELQRFSAPPTPPVNPSPGAQRLSSAPASAPAPALAAPHEKSRAPLFVVSFLAGLLVLAVGAWLFLGRRPAASEQPVATSSAAPVGASAAPDDTATAPPSTGTLAAPTSSASAEEPGPASPTSAPTGTVAPSTSTTRSAAPRDTSKPGTTSAPKPTSKPTAKPLLGRD